jgi:hypothetical protein
LFGLVNDAGAQTLLYPVDDLVEHLTAKQIDLLQEPIFLQGAPGSFDFGRMRITASGHRVLARTREGYEIAFSVHGTRTEAGPEAEAAIEALRHAIRLTPPDRVVLRPGSLLLFHNLRNLHGRSAFSGRRWLQRIYSRKSLAALQKDSGVAGPVFPVVSVMLRS